MTKKLELKVGDRVRSAQLLPQHAHWHSGKTGTVERVHTTGEVLVNFDGDYTKMAYHPDGKPYQGHTSVNRSCWMFSEKSFSENARLALLTKRGRSKPASVVAEATPAVTAVVKPKSKRPHGAQEYKGNGKHVWEDVIVAGISLPYQTKRLRVPGGWLYSVNYNTTFVPVPPVVGYAV